MSKTGETVKRLTEKVRLALLAVAEEEKASADVLGAVVYGFGIDMLREAHGSERLSQMLYLAAQQYQAQAQAEKGHKQH